MEQDSPSSTPRDAFAQAMQVMSEATEAEKEYASCLEEMRSQDGLKMYVDTYAKLYDAYIDLKKQCDDHNEKNSEMQLRVDEMKDMMKELNWSATGLKQQITKQKSEIAKAEMLTDAMHARELAAVETIENLRKQLQRIETELDNKRRLASDDDVGAASAAKEKEKFEKEKNRLVMEIEGLRSRLSNALDYQEDLERKNSAADLAMNKMEEAVQEYENNAMRNQRLIDHLKEEVETLKNLLEARGSEIQHLTEKLSKCDKHSERRDKQLKEQQTRYETLQKEMDALGAKVHATQHLLGVERAKVETLDQTLAVRSKDFKLKEDECVRLRNEVSKYFSQAQNQMKRYQLLETQKANIEHDRENLRQQVAVMERDIMLSKKQSEADKRDIENLQREKEISTKNMQKIQSDAYENLHMLQLQEQRRKKLEYELEQNGTLINKQRLLVRSLEKDKDRLLEEAIALNEKIDDVTEEVRLRTQDILELKKKIREDEVRYKKQQNAFELVRSERNMLHKNYMEALDEIIDLKQKLKMLAYQIEQLKEDITMKESDLKTAEALQAKAQRRVEALRLEVQSGLTQLCDSRAEVQALKQEEMRLNRVIQEGDAQRLKMSKEYDGLMNERDIIGTQLVRRNDELSLLYEKIKILEVTLQRGERQYDQRIDDIRLLRLEIIRLRKEKNLLAKGIENMTDLRLEVFNLERELGRARLRVRALEEALETPLNVHRWRKLGGTNPGSLELLAKVRILQKKILTQSEMLVLKERKLKETENLYNTVKDMLELQPSPEIQVQLNNTQRSLTQRTTKMKCLVAELNMRETQVTEYRLDMERITSELNDYKAKYHEMKKYVEDQKEKKAVKLPPATFNNVALIAPVKALGGGFKLAPIDGK